MAYTSDAALGFVSCSCRIADELERSKDNNSITASGSTTPSGCQSNILTKKRKRNLLVSGSSDSSNGKKEEVEMANNARLVSVYLELF